MTKRKKRILRLTGYYFADEPNRNANRLPSVGELIKSSKKRPVKSVIFGYLWANTDGSISYEQIIDVNLYSPRIQEQRIDTFIDQCNWNSRDTGKSAVESAYCLQGGMGNSLTNPRWEIASDDLQFKTQKFRTIRQ